MHYHAEVWLKSIEEKDENGIKDAVDTIMEPYQNGFASSDPFFDWYEIGGRWDDSGNGTIMEMVIPVSEVLEDAICHTLLTEEDGGCYHTEIWTGDRFIPNPDFDGLILKKLKQLEITNGYLVTVDYHN